MALVLAAYLEDAEVKLPAPSIRLTVSNLLELEDIKHAAQQVREACGKVFEQSRSENKKFI